MSMFSKLSAAATLTMLLAFGSSVSAQEGSEPSTTPAPAPPESMVIASCDFCIPTSVPGGPIQILLEPGFQAGFTHQYTPFKTLTVDGREVANPNGEKINSNTTQLQLNYNLNPRFGFQVAIPYHNRSYTRQGGGGQESGTVSGIGDMVVRGRYAPVARFSEKKTLVWTIDAGMKLPTGNSSLLRDHDHGAAADAHAHGGGTPAQPEHEHDDGGADDHHHDSDHHERAYLAHGGVDHGETPGEEEHHGGEMTPIAMSPMTTEHTHTSAVEGHDLTLGSGSVDGVIGTGVLYRQGNVYASAGTQYLLRTTGTAGYRYGDLWNWRVAPGYLFVNRENRLIGLQVNVSGEHHDPNTVYGVKDHGYTDIIFAGPEVITQGENLSLNLGLDFPVKYHSEGLTLAPDYRARFFFNWKF